MAVTHSGVPVIGGVRPTRARRGFRGIRLWITVASFVVASAGIAAGFAADAYQPLGGWNLIGGFPGLHRPAGAHTVNDFGAQTGEYYIPHQAWRFAVPVSLVNRGPFTVTIEAVSLQPPAHPGYPLMLLPAGPALYWTTQMTTGLHSQLGRPIAGLSLRPGDEYGVYIAVPVRTPQCYVAGAYGIVSSFYVKAHFGPFTKWVRVPLRQPLMLNAPADPPNKPGPGIVCPR